MTVARELQYRGMRDDWYIKREGDRMKWTKTPKTAMLRLADVLGWDVETTGRRWIITNMTHAEGLTYDAIALLAFLTRVAMASTEIGGEGLTGPEVTELIRFRPKHNFNRSNGRYYMELPAKISGGDEISIYNAYHLPEGTDV